ncbi:hypothetical protein MKW92_044680 [Papaver armeniacum]|nr:hypothetical protein MKW92_044680 [Papaver armeniacum]
MKLLVYRLKMVEVLSALLLVSHLRIYKFNCGSAKNYSIKKLAFHKLQSTLAVSWSQRRCRAWSKTGRTTWCFGKWINLIHFNSIKEADCRHPCKKKKLEKEIDLNGALWFFSVLSFSNGEVLAY